jgi:hypothetical protein
MILYHFFIVAKRRLAQPTVIQLEVVRYLIDSTSSNPCRCVVVVSDIVCRPRSGPNLLCGDLGIESHGVLSFESLSLQNVVLMVVRNRAWSDISSFPFFLPKYELLGCAH